MNLETAIGAADDADDTDDADVMNGDALTQRVSHPCDSACEAKVFFIRVIHLIRVIRGNFHRRI